MGSLGKSSFNILRSQPFFFGTTWLNLITIQPVSLCSVSCRLWSLRLSCLPLFDMQIILLPIPLHFGKHAQNWVCEALVAPLPSLRHQSRRSQQQGRHVAVNITWPSTSRDHRHLVYFGNLVTVMQLRSKTDVTNNLIEWDASHIYCFGRPCKLLLYILSFHLR